MLKLFIPLLIVMLAIVVDYNFHDQHFTWISYVAFFGALTFVVAAVVRAFVNEARAAKARKAGKEPKV